MAKMYRVYSIIERPKQDDYWLNIGVAFPHEDGKGLNVMLQALPLHNNGKIVLCEHEAKDHEEDEPADDRRRAPTGGRNGNRDANVSRENRNR